MSTGTGADLSVSAVSDETLTLDNEHKEGWCGNGWEKCNCKKCNELIVRDATGKWPKGTAFQGRNRNVPVCGKCGSMGSKLSYAGRGTASSGMTCEERMEFYKIGRAAAKLRGTKALIEHCETIQAKQSGTNDKEGTKRIWKPMLYWTQQGFSEATVKEEGGGEAWSLYTATS